ncbi:MAG: lysophospholipid acyltransferase family protein [Candidatus Limnocylindrales bacterium]
MTAPAVRPRPSGAFALAGVRTLTWLVCHLPDAPLHRLFAILGEIHYRLARSRRDLARRNLERVCIALEARSLAGPAVAAAAHDPAALERLVRQVFHHHARYYLEVMRVSRYDAAYVARHLTMDDPAMTAAALDTAERGAVFVGLHFGAMELPVRLAGMRRPDPVLVPMETLPDPALQAWFQRQRSAAGVEPIDPRGAGRRLVERARGGGIVAIIGDRPIGGPGRRATLFGAPASLPVGPALVAVEAGVPVWVTGVRRTGWGRYAIRVIPIEVAQGSPKARVAAFVAAEVEALERIIAAAPEQWWTLLFPIWEPTA